MLIQQHPSRLLSDYVLDLLSTRDRRQIEQHLATCPDCRAAVVQERKMILEVRQTLTRATMPQPARLQQLAGVRRAPRRLPNSLWRPAAALGLLLVLLFSTLHFQETGAGGILTYPSATGLAATATHTPTATETSIPDETAYDAPPLTGPQVAQPMGTPLAALVLTGN